MHSLLRARHLTLLSMACICLAVASQVSSAQQPSRVLADYVLFAEQELDFKGRNVDPTRGFINGGHVGVNALDPQDPPMPRLSLGANGAVVMGDGTQIVADTARLNALTNAWDVFVNRFAGSGDVIVRNVGPLAFTAPILGGIPACTSFSPGTTAVTVPSGGSVTIPPDSYGDVRVQDNGILHLQGAGTYIMKSLICGKNTMVVTTPGSIILIAENMTFNNNSCVGPSTDVEFCVRSDNVPANDATVSFGRRTIFNGHISAPNGLINLGNDTNLCGRFWSRAMNSDWNVNVNPTGGCPCEAVGVEPGSWGKVKDLYR